jgi:hypothetical protein
MGKLRIKILCIQLTFLALGLFSVETSAQSTEEMKKIFMQAESYFLYEEFDLANQLYILLDTPENLNIKYKIGVCYLHIADEKDKSIPYLEAAVTTASYDSKTDQFRETRAPLDAFFFLAKAYMINNDLEKALATFQTFDKLAGDTKSKGGMQNVDYIEQQIQACKNAIDFKNKPIEFNKILLGEDFRLGSINDNPVVSYDGNTIAYTEKRGLVNVIFYSKKEYGKWQSPIEITNELKAGEDCTTTGLNSDGTILYLYKTDNYDGAIYTSNYVNNAWTPIRKLNKFVNTKYYESSASESANGKKLYFTSNRPGGQGNLDIYVSEKTSAGDWGPAINIGAGINTPYNEDSPFISKNDSILYFCSEGHSSMGGFDNFLSWKVGEAWKVPVNLGYPINSTDDDKYFQPFNDGANGYYALTTEYKKKDIFYIGMGSAVVVRKYEIKGIFNPTDTTLNLNKTIQLFNRTTGDTLDVGYPNKYTGLYSFNVLPGSFRLEYNAAGYFPVTIDTAIQLDNPTLSLNIDVTLKPDTTIRRSMPIMQISVDTTRYEKINLAKIPTVASIDSNILVRNMNVNDVGDKNILDSDILYFTVQVIALHNPVDVSYFKYISDMKVLYNDSDKFYRYMTGKFKTREEATKKRLELIRKGYPEEIFIKKVSK